MKKIIIKIAALLIFPLINYCMEEKLPASIDEAEVGKKINKLCKKSFLLDIDAVKKCIAQGTPVKHPGISPIFAVISGLQERPEISIEYENRAKHILKILIKAGANINFVNKLGETPLMSAVWFAQKDNVKVLLKFGADRDYKNSQGDTVLTFAGSAKSESYYAEMPDYQENLAQCILFLKDEKFRKRGASYEF